VTEVTNPFRFGKADGWWTEVSVPEKDANPGLPAVLANMGHRMCGPAAWSRRKGWAIIRLC